MAHQNLGYKLHGEQRRENFKSYTANRQRRENFQL